MTSRALRLMDLADRLRASAETTVDALAATLGVSARTVRRDLAALRDRGMPITGQSGPGGGVRLEGARGVATVHLANAEVVALWLAARLARAVADVPWNRRSQSALAKLLAALPKARARELRDLCGRIVIGPPASARVRDGLAEVPAELLRLFEEAAGGGVGLSFRYRGRDGRVTTRHVEPHGMAVTPPVWYLLGRDVDKAAARMFRMDRIVDPALRRTTRFRPDAAVVEALLTAEVEWEPLLAPPVAARSRSVTRAAAAPASRPARAAPAAARTRPPSRQAARAPRR